MCVQDVTHKVVEAIGTIARSSLEQTTWLRRNLEVKASPQIVVDGTNLEADVEGLSASPQLFSGELTFHLLMSDVLLCRFNAHGHGGVHLHPVGLQRSRPHAAG